MDSVSRNPCPTPDSKLNKDQNQNIQVYARVRPMNAMERSKNSLVVIDCPGSREVVVKERSANNLTKTFTFDKVFGPASKQIDVYKVVVAPLIEQVLLGYNCTVFAYGQTGTGKTFTMEGERSPDAKIESLTWETDPLTGIVPRALSQLFDELRLQNAEFTVRVSHLELYNEELFDLLSPTDDSMLRTLRLFEDSGRKGSVIIQGLEEVTVHSKQEVYSIMERGSIRRKTAATQMNATSSRSHTVFTLTVHIKEASIEGEELLKIGKLHLVDLAGSENIGRSGAIDKRAREAGSINQSLLTLGRVITALVERAPHVPYRESKLTRILQDSLGGRTKTSIIATVSPASYNIEETLSTLDYAHRAKNITNRPEINQKLTKRAMLRAYTEEIERLRRDLVATREKNGVYMDKENYDAMTAKLDCQNEDLSEKITQVRALQEVIDRKEEETTSLQLQLEEAKDDVTAANQIIEETQTKLAQTLLKLRETEFERDQQHHLVGKHVSTEKQLTKEAAHLMKTTEESTSNLEKLYRKLDRKKNVEQQNFEAGKRFKEDLGSQLNAMCAGLEAFRADHSSFCGVQRMKLDSFLQEKETKFASLNNQIANFLKQTNDLVKKSQDLVEKETTSTEAWASSVEKEIVTTSSAARKEADDWKDQVTSKMINKLKSALNGLTDQMNQLGTSFNSQITDQNNVVNEYVETRISKLEESRKSIETFLMDQMLANDEAVAIAGRAENLTGEYVRNFETSAQSIMANMKKMVKNAHSFRNIIAENSKTQTNCLAKSINQLESFTNVVKTDFEKNKAEIEVLHTKSNESSLTTGKLLDNKLSDITRALEECGKGYINELNNSVIDQSKYEKAAWERTQLYIGDKMNGRREELQEFGDELKDSLSGLESHLLNNNKEMQEDLGGQQAANRAFITGTMDELEDHCETINKWSEGTRGHVLEQSGKLSQFWDSTYMVDLPTGMTPQRKVYEFPRTLSATSPHERILSRFPPLQKPPLLDKNEIF